MDLEDRLTIQTPEGVDLEVTLAGLGSRVGAGIIDNLILGAVSIAIVIAITILGFGDVSEDILLLIFGIGAMLLLVTFFGYYLLFETLNSGKTPGKAAMGIRVIRVDGRPLSFGPVAIRNLLRIVDYLPVFYAVGLTSIVATARNQRVGDLAAGTVVIRDRRQPPPAAVLHAPEALDRLPPWDVSALTDEEVGLVRRFMERSPTLEPSKRLELAGSIADRLRPKVVAPDDPSGAEAFLARLLDEKLHRQR